MGVPVTSARCVLGLQTEKAVPDIEGGCANTERVVMNSRHGVIQLRVWARE